MKRTLVVGFPTLFIGVTELALCNGTAYGALQPNPEDLASACRSSRTFLIPPFGKHVPIPSIAAQEIGVDTILSWTQDVIVTPDAPRKGRELQVCLHLHGAAVVVKVFKAIPRTSTGKASGSSPPC